MAAGQPLDIEQELLDNFEHSLRVTEHLVRALPRSVWSAQRSSGGRSIAAIVAHMQGVRLADPTRLDQLDLTILD